jgi:hypothetical protein
MGPVWQLKVQGRMEQNVGSGSGIIQIQAGRQIATTRYVCGISRVGMHTSAWTWRLGLTVAFVKRFSGFCVCKRRIQKPVG